MRLNKLYEFVFKLYNEEETRSSMRYMFHDLQLAFRVTFQSEIAFNCW